MFLIKPINYLKVLHVHYSCITVLLDSHLWCASRHRLRPDVHLCVLLCTVKSAEEMVLMLSKNKFAVRLQNGSIFQRIFVIYPKTLTMARASDTAQSSDRAYSLHVLSLSFNVKSRPPTGPAKPHRHRAQHRTVATKTVKK